MEYASAFESTTRLLNHFKPDSKPRGHRCPPYPAVYRLPQHLIARTRFSSLVATGEEYISMYLWIEHLGRVGTPCPRVCSFKHRHLHRPRPIIGTQALFHIPRKRRIRPILRMRDMLMLYRVEMNVIGVPSKVRLVTNLVLPESPLPDC